MRVPNNEDSFAVRCQTKSRVCRRNTTGMKTATTAKMRRGDPMFIAVDCRRCDPSDMRVQSEYLDCE